MAVFFKPSWTAQIVQITIDSMIQIIYAVTLTKNENMPGSFLRRWCLAALWIRYCWNYMDKSFCIWNVNGSDSFWTRITKPCHLITTQTDNSCCIQFALSSISICRFFFLVSNAIYSSFLFTSKRYRQLWMCRLEHQKHFLSVWGTQSPTLWRKILSQELIQTNGNFENMLHSRRP